MKTRLGKIIKSSFKKSLFYSNLNNKPELNNRLGSYLTGLIEGDGSKFVPKTIRNPKGKLLFLKRYITSRAVVSNASSELKSNVNFSHVTLHPYYVTGFVDGEGSFSVSILKRNAYKTGWGIKN